MRTGVETDKIMARPFTTLLLTSEELKDLAYARSLLESPASFVRFSHLLGSPIEHGLKRLPKGWSNGVYRSTQSALWKALGLALTTLTAVNGKASSERFHKLIVGVSGGVGGAFGVAGLAVELPLSTGIMLRSIADIARSEGHDLTAPDTKLACLEVFALGVKRPNDGDVPSTYWAVRSALAKSVSEAAAYIAERGVVEKGAPALVRFISAIASRFGAMVSEEIVAKSVPLVGAAGGSIINVLFLHHFQNMARGHFIVKRLESTHGTAGIRRLYSALATASTSPARPFPASSGHAVTNRMPHLRRS